MDGMSGRGAVHSVFRKAGQQGCRFSLVPHFRYGRFYLAGGAVVADVNYCRPEPDADVIFRIVPSGTCIKEEGLLYDRQSERVSFLEHIQKMMVSR